jgi:hypothetical protein
MNFIFCGRNVHTELPISFKVAILVSQNIQPVAELPPRRKQACAKETLLSFPVSCT